MGIIKEESIMVIVKVIMNIIASNILTKIMTRRKKGDVQRSRSN